MSKTKEYSVGEVAEILNVPIGTVRSWIYSQKLWSIKRVGRRLIPKKSLETFIEKYNVLVK